MTLVKYDRQDMKELNQEITKLITKEIFNEQRERDKSLKQIADACWIDISSLHHLVNGKRQIGLDNLIKISKALNLNVSDLITQAENNIKTR